MHLAASLWALEKLRRLVASVRSSVIVPGEKKDSIDRSHDRGRSVLLYALAILIAATYFHRPVVVSRFERKTEDSESRT